MRKRTYNMQLVQNRNDKGVFGFQRKKMFWVKFSMYRKEL